MSAPLTRREQRLIAAALDAFGVAIAFTEVDNGVATAHYSAADAEERNDELRRFFAKLARLAPGARRYAEGRFAQLVRETERQLRIRAR